MLIRRAPMFRDCDVTDKSVYFNRRKFLKTAGAAAAAVLSASALPAAAESKLPPFKKSSFSTSEKQTPFKDITTYNNYYEFGTDKGDPVILAKDFHTRPWTIKVEGFVQKPMTLDIDDILKSNPLEERIYRHRCVEAWSMVIPWVGFPLADFIKKLNPTSKATFVEFT